ncbi:MAG: hypothetical protein ACRD8O_03845 [Bryobacteraceae bacterium]
MRYWGYFAAKLAAAAGVSFGLFSMLQRIWPGRQQFMLKTDHGFWLFAELPRFGSDLAFTFAVGAWFLISCGLVYLCVLDQRYRCRVCLRRLRMPIETGSWSSMLQLGRPEIEYICPYGHGKLNVAEVQISGTENPEWTAQGDMWEELAGKSKGDSGD